MRVNLNFIKFYANKAIFINRKFLLGHYFSFFFFNSFKIYLCGFVIKPYKLYIFIKNYFLHFCIYFFKNNLLSQFSTLSDICVVDFPQRLNFRFSVTYVLLSTLFNVRIFLSTFVSTFIPLISLCNFYSSSN